MGKFFRIFNENILKIGVSFLLLFIPLYPKLPSINIAHTWVYIRLEDFAIALVVVIWLLQLVLKKIKTPPKIWIPFVAYLVVGFISLVISLIFIAPHLANFFPSVAILSYFRRIEYMILFFIAFSSVKSLKDLKHYLIILSVAVLLFSGYAFAQRFYLDFWHAFPAFFEKFSFCFPSFQTGNEEFAKGIPLCLPQGARITSTFAGHYDLGAYLVLVIPIFAALIFSVKKKLNKIWIFALTLISMMVIIFTSSRISFLAYILGVTATLVFIKRKKFIIPFYVLSLILLLTFSSSTAKRFMETFRIASVVTNNQGQVVGQSELPADLKNKIKDNVLANVVSQNLPAGSGFLGLPQLNAPQKTNSAIVQAALSIEKAKRLKLENGGVEISTVAGSFLIRKVLVYDISFTTRFQAEWPTAWSAMLRNPLLGSGFATITLAADNDYLRILGETGFLGLISFLSIFIILLIMLKQALPTISDSTTKAYLFGITGGIVGLFINAVLIDVFESSKVAETLWILLGIAVGSIFLYKRDFEYKKYLSNILTSRPFVIFYLFFISLTFYLDSFKNFFVADDFTWLKWAATTNLRDLPKLFIDSQGFFYRPLDKFVMYFLYTLFSFTPQGYHVFIFLIHFLISIGIYIFVFRLLKNKAYAFLSAFIFLLLPSQAENVYWISTMSANLCTLFIVYGLLFWQNFGIKRSKLLYLLSFIFGILAFLSYEMAVVYPFLIVLFDLFITRTKNNTQKLISYIPFFLLIPIYLLIRSISHTVAAGGDYAYSISHLLPNFIGNFLGYLALYIFGEKALVFYEQARNILRADALYILVFLIFAITLVCWFVFANKDKLKNLYSNSTFSLFLFSILFIFVSQLSFLGLGNISERYSYLGSFGFSLLVVLIIKTIVEKLKSEKSKTYLLIFFVLIIGLVYFYQDRLENAQWREASRITNRTLAYLRLYYDGRRDNSTFYFVNTPIRKANAWVFPVGLSDGIWFIYRDDSINIINLSSIRDGQNALSKGTKDKTYVFAFDKNGNIYAVK